MSKVKKRLALFLTLIMTLAILAGCGASNAPKNAEKKENNAPKQENSTKKEDDSAKKEESTEGDWKIGVVTGTVAQNEEEYRAAQNVLKKYGADRVILQTYPEKFMDEQETVIANIAGIAADPKVKALVICQGVPGTSAAIDKVKELRDDLLIIVGTSGEDPNMIAERADIALQMDELGMGTAIVDQIEKQGAKTLVHYSFPRHMSYALLAARRDLLKENCEKKGIEFVDATAPDPTGDAGVSGAQQFILEDVPKKVATYGKDTAFFSTNCSMQPPLIKAVYEEGAIYPQPCCPSPYHGFPSALEINIPEDKKGDIDYVVEEIRKKCKDKGMTGRMSTWPVPVNMMFVEAGADYAVKWIKGEIKDKVDKKALKQAFVDYAGMDLDVNLLVENGKEFKNYFMILIDYINF
jgi:predicted small lipoprotein YifL